MEEELELIRSMPRLSYQLLPKAEYQDGLHASLALKEILQQRKEFIYALQLFDHAVSILESKERRWEEVSPLERAQRETNNDRATDQSLRAWLRIACGHGAISLYSLGKALDNAKGCINKCTAWKSVVSWDDADRAKILFKTHFPGIDNIRHAVTHPAELAKYSLELKKNSFSEAYTADGLAIEATLNAGDRQAMISGLRGRTFSQTHNGVVHSFEMSEQTVAKIVDVIRCFWQVMAPISNCGRDVPSS